MRLGVFEGEVLAFCPTKEKLTQLTGKVFKVDPVYVVDKNIKIVVVLRDVKTKEIFYPTFHLVNEPLSYRSGKFSFINRVGLCFAFSENQIPSNFYDGGDVRKAIVGEPDFVDFLRVYLKGMDFSERNLEYTISKFAKGNFSELNNFIGTTLVSTIGAMLTASLSVNKPAIQRIYTSKFFHGDDVDKLLSNFNEDFLKGLIKQDKLNRERGTPKNKKRNLEEWEKFLVKVYNPNYPCQDLFHIMPLGEVEDNPFDNNNLVV